jgi:hypothetical protein
VLTEEEGKMNQYSVKNVKPGVHIQYNVQQEYPEHRWEVWCDDGIYTFATRAAALKFAINI